MAANDKTKEILEKLEQGIKDAMDSEKFKNFLRVQTQFHNYSANNAFLIYMQRPDATYVAGYQTWKNKFQRNVVKGEKGISILAPSPFKKEIEVNKIDPKTKKPIVDEKGCLIKEKQTVECLTFRKVSVFDIKQTEGKELPTICEELKGNSLNSESIIKHIKEISNVPIIEKEINSGAKGYYSRGENIIAINKGMSLDQTAKTLIHEYAHSQLHNTDAAALYDRATKEVQAESVAFIVSNKFGIDTSSYSFEYLASWSSGKELKELTNSLSLIQKTANSIINKIEPLLNKELELNNSPVNIKIIWSESSDLKEGQLFSYNKAANIFKELDEKQIQLRNNAKEGEYEGYLKTKFEVQLSDGKTSTARFDFGCSGYSNFSECIKAECNINIKNYLKEFTINQYNKKFPAIKHIKESTLLEINKLNELEGKKLTIDEIKEKYKQAGKKLESNLSNNNKEEFNSLKSIVDDMKQAQLTQKQELAKQNSISKVKNLELVQ